MDALTKDKLRAAGLDVDKTVERFAGNDSLYERFLKKFSTDPTYGQLLEAMDAGPGEDLFRSAHTLKGLSSNLGMVRLSELCDEIVRKLRANETDGFETDFANVKAEYGRILDVLRETGEI